MAENEINEVKVRNILRLIDHDIDQLNTNRNRNNNNNVEYKKKRKIIIENLDRVEKIIMQKNWGDNNYNTRKYFRSLIQGFYKKLNYCSPIRTKEQYESSEYQDPEPNDDREDVDKCPREEFTETYVKEKMVWL